MNFLQLVNGVLKNIDETTISAVSGATGMADRAKDWVNETIQYIYSRKTNWSFREATTTIATVSGTKEYSIASGIDKFSVRSLNERNTGTPLHYIDYEDWQRNLDHLISDSTTGDRYNGMPTRYTIHDEKIQVWPTPDAVYTLDLFYFVTFTELTSDSDTPIIPTDYHYVIRRGATFLAKHFLGDPDSGKEEALFKEGLRLMMAQDRRYGNRVAQGRPDESVSMGELD